METTYKNSPWGVVQDTTVLADGICSVSTASHGGIKLDDKRQALMPENWRMPGGWYEEDCDWCLPFIIFQGAIMVHGNECAVRNIQNSRHVEILKDWHPDKYEEWFKTTLKPGDSYIRTHPLKEEKANTNRKEEAKYLADYVSTEVERSMQIEGFGAWDTGDMAKWILAGLEAYESINQPKQYAISHCEMRRDSHLNGQAFLLTEGKNVKLFDSIAQARKGAELLNFVPDVWEYLPESQDYVLVG